MLLPSPDVGIIDYVGIKRIWLTTLRLIQSMIILHLIERMWVFCTAYLYLESNNGCARDVDCDYSIRDCNVFRAATNNCFHY